MELDNNANCNFFLFLIIALWVSCKPQEIPIKAKVQFETRNVEEVQLRLSKSLVETSGLVKINNQYWSHNDSGSEPILYQFDPYSGKVIRQVIINNAENMDWEEITTDDAFIYIADFGNNLGARKDLVVYRLEKIKFIGSNKEKLRVKADKIFFTYPDQKKFPGNYNHNFDAEAMLSRGDSLYIFTKNWNDNRCKLYSIPKTAGTWQARFIDDFDTQGLITGSSYNQEENKILLLGYVFGNTPSPFVWTLSEFENSNFFSGKQERFNLNIARQTEAISLESDSTFLITAENENLGWPAVFRLRTLTT